MQAATLAPQTSRPKRHLSCPGDALPNGPPESITDFPDRGRQPTGEGMACTRRESKVVRPHAAEETFLSARHWNDLGNALQKLGRYSEARTAFREARKLAPHDTDIVLNLACLEMERGRYQHAYDMLQMALHKSPQTVWIKIRMARMCLELGKKKRANALIGEWALWHLDDDMSAELAAIMIQLGHIRDGLPIMEGISDLSRLSLYASVRLATALEQASCMDAARRCMASLPLPEHVCNPALREELFTLAASVAWREGNLSEARRLLRFLDLPPVSGICRSTRPYILLAEVCYQQADMEAAKPAFAIARSTWMKAASVASFAMLESTPLCL